MTNFEMNKIRFLFFTFFAVGIFLSISPLTKAITYDSYPMVDGHITDRDGILSVYTGLNDIYSNSYYWAPSDAHFWDNAYFQFDLSWIPGDAVINSVTLNVNYHYNQKSSSPEGSSILEYIDDIGNALDSSDWDLNVRTGHGILLDDTTSYGWKSVDVTNDVKDAISRGETKISFRARGTDRDLDSDYIRYYFKSSEAATDSPYLHFDYTSGTTSTTTIVTTTTPTTTTVPGATTSTTTPTTTTTVPTTTIPIETFSPLHIDGQFWYDENNNPVFLRGVIYLLHDGGDLWGNYKPQEVDGNLSLIKDMGFNAVTVHVSMRSFSSSERQYSTTKIGYLLDFLTRCKNKGLYVVLRTPDWASTSGWVYEQWKKNDWFLNETFIQTQEYFLHNLTKAIVDNSLQDVIAGVDLWAEAEKKYNFLGIYDDRLDTSAILPVAEANWRSWLKNRYSSVDDLNVYWSANPTSASSLDEVPFPTEDQLSNFGEPRLVDYRKWMDENFYKVTKRRRDALKKYYDFPASGSISGFLYNDKGGDYRTDSFICPEIVASLFDFICTDPYRVHRGEIVSMATYGRKFNKPFLAMEYGARTEHNVPGMGERQYTIEEAKTFWTRAFYRMLAHRVSASMIWYWQERDDGADWSYGFGLVNQDGNDKIITPFIKELNRRVMLVEPYMDSALMDYKIGILFSQTSMLGKNWRMRGQAGLLPLAFDQANIFPTSIFEGPSRTTWDRTLFQPDDFTRIDDLDILVYDYTHYKHTNTTWWNTYISRSVNERELKLIAQGLPCQDGNGGQGDDEYAQDGYMNLDWTGWFPISGWSKGPVFSPDEYGTNGVFLWGPYEGENFFYYGYEGHYGKDPVLNPGSTIIGEATIQGTNYPMMVANDKVFFITAKHPEARVWSMYGVNGEGQGGSLDSWYDLDEPKKLLTALEWFNYTPKFNVDNKYVRSQVFGRRNGVTVLFGNEWPSSQSFTFHLNKLTDYELSTSKTYKLYWVHDWTPTSGIYTGSDLQGGISLNIGPYTIAPSVIYENKDIPIFIVSDATNTNEVYDSLNNKFQLEFDCKGSHLSAIHSPNKPNKIKIRGVEIPYDENLNGAQSWNYDRINKILTIKFEC